MRLSLALCLALLGGVATAHFTLNYPPTRGFDEDNEIYFCGDFPLAAVRTPFPLGAAFIDITSHHPSATWGASISFDQNPTQFSQFNATASGTSYPMLEPFYSINYQGEACVPVNVQSLGVQGVQNGTNATIQVSFNGGDGQLYQCADVVLVSNYTIPSSTICSNGTSSSATSTTPSGTSNAPSPTSSTAKSSAFESQVLHVGSVGCLGLAVVVLALF